MGRKKVVYMVAQPQNVTRAHIEGHGVTQTVWVPVASLGQFESRRAAKVAFMVAMEPDLKGASETFIVRHFDQQARNIGYAKIVKVPSCS